MPFFTLIAELKSVDAIKNVIDGTVHSAPLRTERFPSITLIRLYELLKNNSRLAKADPRIPVDTWVSIECQ
jgi:hypothetical protein